MAEKYQGIAVVYDHLCGISPVFYKAEHHGKYSRDAALGAVAGPMQLDIIESIWLGNPVDYDTITNIGWALSESAEKKVRPLKRYPGFSQS